MDKNLCASGENLIDKIRCERKIQSRTPVSCWYWCVVLVDLCEIITDPRKETTMDSFKIVPSKVPRVTTNAGRGVCGTQDASFFDGDPSLG